MALELVRPVNDALEFGYCFHDHTIEESGWLLCLECGDWWPPFVLPWPKLVVRGRVEA